MDRFFIDNLWRWKCGFSEIKQNQEKLNIENLFETEWSKEFENYMRNRLVMGAFRYGKLNDENKNKYDRIKSSISRLHKYQKTGNLEHLIDVANLMMMEYEEGNHQKRHFESIDDGEHTKIIL